MAIRFGKALKGKPHDQWILAAWILLVVFLIFENGDWVYWFILAAWAILQLVSLLQQTDLYTPWRRIEKKRDALGFQLLQVAQRYQEAGTLIPYWDAMNSIGGEIAIRRKQLTAPGASGDTSALDDFEWTLQPLMRAAEELEGFMPVAYLAAAIRIGKDWVPTEDMRDKIVQGMLSDLAKAIPEMEPLVERYRKLFWISKARRYRAALTDGVLRRRRQFGS